MIAFAVADLIARQGTPDRAAYLEFIREASMSLGLYTIPAGADDPQQPHSEDEVYYVVGGRGQIFVGGEDRPVEPGSIVFVARGVEHRFHDVTETLQIVVFFAPAEYANR